MVQCKETGPWTYGTIWEHGFWWPQWQKLQHKGSEDRMQDHKNQKAHEGNPNHRRMLSKKLDVKNQLTTDSRKLNELVDHFKELYKHKQSKDNWKKMKVVHQKHPHQWATAHEIAKEQDQKTSPCFNRMTNRQRRCAHSKQTLTWETVTNTRPRRTSKNPIDYPIIRMQWQQSAGT